MHTILFFCCVSFVVLCYLFVPEVSALRVRLPDKCPQLSLKHGSVRYRQRGRFAKFSCETGYIIAGDKYAICSRGKWDSPIPKCVRPTCSNVKSPLNGLTYASHRGAVLNFFCKSGYQLKGSNITYCDGKKWDANLPTCIANDTRPAYFCDFESEDLCGWSHDLNHDFDWRRMRYNTPSGYIGTGPNFDHTKGHNQDGYYMYIESSSRNENDTARLISPVYDATTNDTCVEFYYHMYGTGTGTLNVYVKKMNDSWDLKPESAIFTKSGNQQNEWYRSFHNLGPVNQEFQIVIEGLRGPTYLSDIALDDVSVIENCNPNDYTTAVFDEFSEATEAYTVIESCANRCGMIANTSETGLRQCDCDVNCIELNSCCPDFPIFCVLAVTDDTTEIPTTYGDLDVFTATSTSSQKPTTLFNLPTSTPQKPPPVLIINTPEPPIIRKLPSTTVKPKKIINDLPHENDVNKKWRPKQTKLENDMLTPAQPTEAVTLVNVQSTKQNPLANYEEEFKRHFSSSGLTKQEIYKEETKSNSGLYIIVGSVVFLLSVAAVITVVVKKCDAFRYLGIKKINNSNNADSQSDVRFLTHDEILDFRLATMDD